MKEHDIQKIEDALARSKRKTLPLDNMRESAVLLPLFFKEGELYLLFTKRSQDLENHKGEVSFPGGGREPDDPNLEFTALRETEEEIGLPPKETRILGRLDDMLTYTRFRISPFVGLIPHPYPLQISEVEIEKVIEVPISVLLDKSRLDSGRTGVFNGAPYRTYSYDYEGEIIWGATARITIQFLNLVYGFKAPGWVEINSGLENVD